MTTKTIARHLLALSAVRAMGGQAVLNGVMMRGEYKYAVACRRMDDSIDVKTFDVPSFAQKFVKIPFLRGVMGLGESMALGYRALMHSADLSLIDEEAKAKREAGEEVPEEEEKSPLPKTAVAFSIVFSLTFFIGLFIVFPHIAGSWIQEWLGFSHWQSFVIESVLRLVIFIGYLSLVALIPDIKRVFQYHGAEHKAIAAYENDVVLTPESTQQFTTAHVRCGTNFLLIVMVMSIIFYAGIAVFFPDLALWARLLSRIVVIPMIAGVSYEIIKGAAPRMSHPLVRIIVKPGLWLQKITTRRPSNDQCEVSLAALNASFTQEQLDEVATRTKVSAEPSWQTVEAVVTTPAAA